jgi:hypothetical protein
MVGCPIRSVLERLSLAPDEEEKMKRFVCATMGLVLISVFMGCFVTMTPEERKHTYDVRKAEGDNGLPKRAIGDWASN